MEILSSNPESLRYSPPQPTIFKIEDAEKQFNNAFEIAVPGFKLLPEYREVIEWLEDNKGRGIALIGSNGRGKTILARYVIPMIFAVIHRKHFEIANAQEMNQNIDELLRKLLLSIDDIGTEDQRVVYGERRWAFPELVDNAEKNRNILILTSNLDADAIEKKYGLRTRERVRAVCKVVVFKGESLRK